MKVNAKALFEVVRNVVRDELRQALPELIREHLAEHYVRRVIAEQVGHPTPELSKEVFDLIETPIAPRVARSPPPRPSRPVEPPVIPGIPSFLMENVQPLSADDGVNPTILPDFGGFDMSAIADLSNRLDKKTASKKSNGLVSTNPALDELVNTRFTG